MKAGVLIALICLSTASVQAAVSRGMVGAGLSYPGAGIRYFITDRTCIEAKAQAESNVFVGGLRGYRYTQSSSTTCLFWGLEADMVTFAGEQSKGTGMAGEVFVGGEHFVSDRLSLQLDFGPGYVSLSDADSGLSVSGLEFIVNFGINYYFRCGR